MLDKKIRRRAIAIQSTFPDEQDWSNYNSNDDLKLKKNFLYNLFDDEWVKKYILNHVLFSRYTFLTIPVKNFMQNNNPNYEQIITTLRKRALRYQIKLAIEESKNLTDLEFFDDICKFVLHKTVNAFKIIDIDVFTDMFNEVFLEYYSNERKTINNIVMDSHDKLACAKLVKDLFPKTGKFKGKRFEDTRQFTKDNLPYHITDKNWVEAYFFTGVDKSLLYKQTTLKSFLQSAEFDAMLNEYQNKLIDTVIKDCYVSDGGHKSIDTTKPIEESVETFTSRVKGILLDVLHMDEKVATQKLAEKSEFIWEICVKHYENEPVFNQTTHTVSHFKNYIKGE